MMLRRIDARVGYVYKGWQPTRCTIISLPAYCVYCFADI